MSEIKLPPELEDAYQAYWQRGTQEALAEVILGSSAYARRFRMPKWNIQPNMLMEPKVAVRYWHILGLPTSKSEHAQRREYFGQLRNQLNDAWYKYARLCATEYGDHGALVSGVFRSHFPMEEKRRLRFVNDAYNMTTDAWKLHDALTKTRSPAFHW